MSLRLKRIHRGCNIPQGLFALDALRTCYTDDKNVIILIAFEQFNLCFISFFTPHHTNSIVSKSKGGAFSAHFQRSDKMIDRSVRTTTVPTVRVAKNERKKSLILWQLDTHFAEKIVRQVLILYSMRTLNNLNFSVVVFAF